VPRKCSSNIYDILPIIDGNYDYDAGDSYDCNIIYQTFNVQRDEPLADFYIHYTSCKHIVIEEGKRNKPVGKIIEQIDNTVKILRQKGHPVDFIALVTDGLTAYDKRNYECRKNVLYKKIPIKQGPVIINGLELRCFRKQEIQSLRKNSRPFDTFK
jgi:hypothetical protein